MNMTYKSKSMVCSYLELPTFVVNKWQTNHLKDALVVVGLNIVVKTIRCHIYHIKSSFLRVIFCSHFPVTF